MKLPTVFQRIASLLIAVSISFGYFSELGLVSSFAASTDYEMTNNLGSSLGSSSLGSSSLSSSSLGSSLGFSIGLSATQGEDGWFYLERTGGANGSTFTEMDYNRDANRWEGKSGNSIQNGRITLGSSGTNTNDAALAWECPKDGYYKISGWVICEKDTGDGVLVKVVKSASNGKIDWASGQIWPELERGSSSWYNSTGYAIVRDDTERDNLPGLYQNTVLFLEEGERVFFLANRNNTTDGDTVLWNPRIEEIEELPFSFENQGLVVSQGYVDGSLALVNRGDGTYDAYNSVGYAHNKNIHHRWRISDLNPLTYEQIDDLPDIGNCDGYPSPWLNYIENTHKINDNGTPDDPSDDLIIAFMHLENYTNVNQRTTNVTYKIGLALSRDGGDSFTQVGDIIGNAVDQSVIKANDISGGFNIQGVPFFIAPDGYLYIYYSESMPIDTSVRQYGRMTLSVARAKYNDVVRALLYNDKNNLATLFKKYYNGVWGEPGIDTEQTYSEYKISGGYGASIEDSDRGAHTMICYNDYAEKSVMVNCSNNGFSIKFSKDPNSWFVPSYIFDKGNFYFYGTLADEFSDNPYLLGETFNVFYGALSGNERGYKQTTFTLSDKIQDSDPDALKDYLRMVENLTQTGFSSDAWEEFENARLRAEETLNDSYADQSSLNEALYNLGTAYKNIRIPNGTIFTEVTNPGTLYVEIGTDFEDLDLPLKIGVVKATPGTGSGSEALGSVLSTMVDVSWDRSSYDADTAATYTLSGTLSGPSHFDLGNLTAEAKIAVGESSWSDDGEPDPLPEVPDPYEDNFSDGLVGGWYLANESGKIEIEDHYLRITPTNTKEQPLVIDANSPSFSDGVLEMTIKPKITAQSGWGTSNLGNFGIVFRYNDASNYLALEYDYGTYWYIKNGSNTIATISNGPKLSNGDTYRIKLQLEGTKISAWADDVLFYERVLPSIPTTPGKLGARGWGFCDLQIENVSVNPLPLSEPEYPGFKNSKTVRLPIDGLARTGTVPASAFGIDTSLRGLTIQSIEPSSATNEILEAMPSWEGLNISYTSKENLKTSGLTDEYLITFSCEKYADFQVALRFETFEEEPNEENPTPENPNEKELKEWVQQVLLLKEASYTIESWNYLQQKYNNAVIVLDKILTAAPDEVEQAIQELKDAIQSLIPVSNEEFIIKIVKGTASVSSALPGSIISVVADSSQDNKKFKRWTSNPEIDFVDRFNSSTTFIMPNHHIEIVAEYEAVLPEEPQEPADTLYKLAFVTQPQQGGTLENIEKLEYLEGEQIELAVTPHSNYQFIGWESTHGGYFADTLNTKTIFTMPASSTTIIANFKVVSAKQQTRKHKKSSGGTSIPDSVPSAILNNISRSEKTLSLNTMKKQAEQAIKIAQNEKQSAAIVNLQNPGKVPLAFLQEIAGKSTVPVIMQADNMNASKSQVLVRLSLDPKKSKQNLNLHASSSSNKAKNTQELFKRWFSNSTKVLAFEQSDGFGQELELAIKLDPEFISKKEQLKIYIYNSKTNSYKELNSPVQVDRNNYLHFILPDIQTDSIVFSLDKLSKY